MTYTVEIFQSLVQRFPTWPSLKEHLESEAGGSLRVIENGAAGVAIIRYVKGTSDLRTPELGVGFFRSIVWDMAANKPLCVAPPKARETAVPVGTNLAATEDFVDGFMVNAWVSSTGALQVATRTTIGGDNRFYGTKTFGEMFDEALAASPLKSREGLASALDSGNFASFCVQHPEHRVVAKIASPALYVIHVGSVTPTGSVQISERAVNWPQALGRLQVQSFPLRRFSSEQEIKDLLMRTAVQRGWRWQGLVFKDGAGGRWRLRSPTYQKLRDLRGGEAAPVDRFLRLRAAGQVKEYLTHYGEDRTIFWDYEQRLRARTVDVLRAYGDVHKAHAIPFVKLPEAYQPAVFRLHAEYLNQLRPKGAKVRLQNVIEVINEMKLFERRRLLLADPYSSDTGAQGTVVAAAAVEASTGPAEEQTAVE